MLHLSNGNFMVSERGFPGEDGKYEGMLEFVDVGAQEVRVFGSFAFLGGCLLRHRRPTPLALVPRVRCFAPLPSPFLPCPAELPLSSSGLFATADASGGRGTPGPGPCAASCTCGC